MRENYLKEYYSFLRFPSVSTDDQYKQKLGVRTMAGGKTHQYWSGDKACSHARASHRLGTQQTSARASHGFDLWALRCATARSSGALGFAAVRTRFKKRLRLCARRYGQQGPDPFTHSRDSGDYRTRSRFTGELASGDRRRRGNWQRKSWRFSKRKSRCTEVRRRSGLRYRNDRARRANVELRLARGNRSRNQSDRTKDGLAFGYFWRRRCQSNHRVRATARYAS